MVFPQPTFLAPGSFLVLALTPYTPSLPAPVPWRQTDGKTVFFSDFPLLFALRAIRLPSSDCVEWILYFTTPQLWFVLLIPTKSKLLFDPLDNPFFHQPVRVLVPVTPSPISTVDFL